METDFAFLFGTWLPDPNYAAENGVQLIGGDNLDDLSALQPKASPEPETIGRAIHDQAGNALWVSAEVDDQAGSLLDDDAPGAASLARGEGGHGFGLGEDFPHGPMVDEDLRSAYRVNTCVVRAE